jgi:hypothetical protein
MGALKPWHVLVLLFLIAVVITIGVAAVTAIVRNRRR